MRGSVGEIYGRYAAKFGFEGGEEESTWKEIQKGFVDAFRQKEPLVFPGEPKAAIAQLERQWWRELVQRTFAPLGPFPRIEEFFETLYSVFRTSQAWQLESGCQELLSQLRKRGKKLGLSPILIRAFGIYSKTSKSVNILTMSPFPVSHQLPNRVR
ncbi:hypothetical protein MYX84_08520 [Acidobacteria bacterium AH-259-O06]|nr:hypothetical protein [Acidobacteria bacterium AH-259-O06]